MIVIEDPSKGEKISISFFKPLDPIKEGDPSRFKYLTGFMNLTNGMSQPVLHKRTAIGYRGSHDANQWIIQVAKYQFIRMPLP